MALRKQFIYTSMNLKRILLSLMAIFMMASGCENPLEDRVEELEYQLALYEQQQSVIDSLVNVLFKQQAFIDSLLAQQKNYMDSLNTGVLAKLDSLNGVQQEIIDMIIGTQDLTGTGDNYVRISNVQICWGSGETNIHGTLETFPKSFTETPIVIMNPIAEDQKIPSVEDITFSTATFYINSLELTTFNYQAVGYWL